jgi:dihydroxy-acid dehydratase
MINIDLIKRSIDIDITPHILSQRLGALLPRPPTTEKGWLAMYQQLVQPLSCGAVLGKRSIIQEKQRQ